MNFKQKLRLAGLVIATLLLLVLIVQNRSDTTLSFLMVSTTMPLALLIAIVFVLGVLAGVALAYVLIGRKVDLRALQMTET